MGSGTGTGAIRSRRIVTPAGVVAGAVVFRGGRIAAVGPGADLAGLDPSQILDVGDLVVMPGVVDTHVHVNEPGRTDWEGYATATRAAAAGGVTTLVDMPLNCLPVTTSLAAFETKLNALNGQLSVDCGFYGGVVPGNAAELAPMARRGILGFKAFLVHSGIDDFPAARPGDLDVAMPILKGCGVPLLVHAELESALEGGEAPTGEVAPAGGAPQPYADYLKSRPHEWEDRAIELVIAKAQATGCRSHIVHLSSAHALPLLTRARRAGVPITAETCPHYLTFTAEEVPAGDTRFKCAPPIREGANRERLWRGLKDGAIDFVVSDHSPCAPHLKLMERGDFEHAWGGIAGLQFGLSTVWTGAAARGATLVDLARWLAERPAALVGLSGRKGVLAPGADADLVVWSPEAEAPLGQAGIHHRHKVTPYAGRVMKGVVEATLVRGECVYERGAFIGAPRGLPLLRI